MVLGIRCLCYGCFSRAREVHVKPPKYPSVFILGTVLVWDDYRPPVKCGWERQTLDVPPMLLTWSGFPKRFSLLKRFSRNFWGWEVNSMDNHFGALKRRSGVAGGVYGRARYLIQEYLATCLSTWPNENFRKICIWSRSTLIHPRM